MLNIFCSSVFIANEYDSLKKKCRGNLSLADHNLNNNLIKGLIECGEKVVLVNSTPIPSFPNFKGIFIKKRKFSYTGNENEDVDIGYINLPFIKPFLKYRAAYKSLCKIIEGAGAQKVNILVYDLHPFFAKAITKAKKRYKKVNTTAVLPDIPDVMLKVVYGDNPSKKALSFTNEKMKYINSFDSYVFVSALMSEKVDVKDKPFTVVEGIYNESAVDFDLNRKPEKAILYSGLLRTAYGVKTLIDVFKNMQDKSIKLWLCGSGELTAYAKEAAAENENIEYFGYLNTKDLRERQNKAYALINPRPDGEDFTRYSFPSKTMEYLASGKPVIGYLLAGYPQEYCEYLYVPKADTQDALQQAITDLFNQDTDAVAAHCEKARAFILKNKNPKNQCEKIQQMLKNI
ncbi:MAG: glycosyltransferase [Oscillospiraceae bacterium]|nr:glycosyltransferase [Candidatus Equicaccousia limihippi]